MKYEPVQPYTKDEAEAVFAHGTSAEITNALLGVTYYVEDWRWVQSACLSLLNRDDSQVQWTTIQCLGHLATFHHVLDLALVLPTLQVYESHPRLRGVVSDAYDDIAIAIKFAPDLVERWDGLPQSLKDVLIEEGIFDGDGRFVGDGDRRDYEIEQ